MVRYKFFIRRSDDDESCISSRDDEMVPSDHELAHNLTSIWVPSPLMTAHQQPGCIAISALRSDDSAVIAEVFGTSVISLT